MSEAVKFLVVYEEVPELTEVFILEIPRDDYNTLRKIRDCHDNFINTIDTPDEVCDTISKLKKLGTVTMLHSTQSEGGSDEPPYFFGSFELIFTGIIL